jgi:4-hydroxy-2-oxoheptanedioate aldolase
MSHPARDMFVRCSTSRPVIGSLVVEGTDFRRRIASGEPLLGTVTTVPDVVLAELTASAVEFVWIDLEHGALGAADVAPLAIAARAGGATSLVRLLRGDDAALGPALDAGVDGVVAPRVETAAEAEGLVEQLRHPPRGSRGVAARRGSAYGRDGASTPEPLCFVQIESPQGLAAAAEIAAVDGVDALVVGCADLALRLGDSAVHSDRMRTAVASVQRAAELAGIASGVAGPDDPELLARLAGGRSNVLVLAADVRLYARALHAGFDRLRADLAPRPPRPEEAHVGA